MAIQSCLGEVSCSGVCVAFRRAAATTAIGAMGKKNPRPTAITRTGSMPRQRKLEAHRGASGPCQPPSWQRKTTHRLAIKSNIVACVIATEANF